MKKIGNIIRFCVDNGVRILGPVFVVMALGLILGVVYVLVTELFPYYVPSLVSPVALLYFSSSAFILFNILYNYYMTVITLPGSTPNLGPEETSQIEALIKTEPNVRRGEGFTRICKFCKKPKPPRTHHCHICKTCVLRMDHHCPWVSNCVGFHNHRYFILFLIYLCVGCLYVSVLSFFPFYASTDYREVSGPNKTAVLFVFVMTLSVMIAVGMLLIWHLYLVFTAQTTIEVYYNRNKARHAHMRGETYHNEYDLGFVKNWQIFFGPSKLWFMPTQKPPPGDGMVYMTRTEHTKKIGNVNHHFV